MIISKVKKKNNPCLRNIVIERVLTSGFLSTGQHGDYGRWQFGGSGEDPLAARHAILPGTRFQ